MSSRLVKLSLGRLKERGKKGAWITGTGVDKVREEGKSGEKE